ncbi:unnamed protein product, partial [Brachionus calyciflorus]
MFKSLALLLIIFQLTINSQNLNQIDDGAFENVGRLDRIYFNGIKNLPFFFENNRIQALSNITSYLSLSNARLNNNNVIPIIDNLKSWPLLQSLTITNNDFSHFSYDFTNFTSLSFLDLSNNLIQTFDINSNFTSLSSLDLSNNLIQTFDIKSNRLNNLNLFNNKIEKLEKEMFVYLPNLEYLRIDSNKISRILNDSFHSTKSLRTIDLDNNKIDYIEPNSFCNLKLSSLYLSGNNLSNVSLYCLENVGSLYLNNVQFEGEIDQKRLGNPKNAYQLYLSNNKISKINLENMTSLKYFYLDSNELVNFTSETIQAVPNLNTLGIRNNKFTDKSLENFNHLKKLQYLYLSNNLLTKFEPNMLAESKQLYSLDIGRNNLENVEFGSLPNLKELFIYYNKLKFVGKDSFSKLSNLERLNLESNIISRIHPKTFASNVNL